MKEVSSVLRRNLLALCGTIQHRNMERFVPATSIVLMLNYALQGQMMFADRSRYLGLFCNDMVNTVYSSIAVRISQNVILPLEIAGRIWSICFRRR